jgi:signal transduction histidine kinase
MNRYDPVRLLTAINEMVELNEISPENFVIPDSRERLKQLLQILIGATDCQLAFILELKGDRGAYVPVPETLVSTDQDEGIISAIETRLLNASREDFESRSNLETWAISNFARIESFCAIPVYIDDRPVSIVCLVNRDQGFTGTEENDLLAHVRFIYVVYRALRFFGTAVDTIAQELGRRAVATQSNVWFGRKDMWTGLSHDLNGIFAVIALQAELMRTQLENPTAISKGLDRIDTAIDQIGQLTARLDLLGQLQGSESRPTPLLDGARTFEFLSKFLFAHGSQLVLTIDCDIEVHVPLSGRELLTILHALLSNAFEASSQDRTPVYLDIFFDTSRTVSIKVTNSGPRFQEDVLSQLFTQRVTTHLDEDGKINSRRGFGLLAVKTLLDGVGGTLNIESTDIATQTTVILPIAPAPTQFGYQAINS